MASRLCPECEDRYPNTEDFHECPLCGVDTSWKNLKPTIAEDVAEARRRRADLLQEFQDWCEENGRTENASPTVYFPKGAATEEAIDEAYAVIRALEESIPTYALGTLYIV